MLNVQYLVIYDRYKIFLLFFFVQIYFNNKYLTKSLKFEAFMTQLPKLWWYVLTAWFHSLIGRHDMFYKSGMTIKSLNMLQGHTCRRCSFFCNKIQKKILFPYRIQVPKIVAYMAFTPRGNSSSKKYLVYMTLLQARATHSKEIVQYFMR